MELASFLYLSSSVDILAESPMPHRKRRKNEQKSLNFLIA